MTAERWASAAQVDLGGRLPMSPIQGFGRLWQKTYRTQVAGVEPVALIATWKEHFPVFWPEGNRFTAPLTQIAPGEVAVIDMALPGRMKLSTGVMVLYADHESFTLMTPQGHLFAGWITFSAAVEDGATVAQAQVLMRASDPLTEIGLTLGGHRQEDRFWANTLTSLAAYFGHEADVDTRVVCVDRRRQWSRWRNVRHSAAIHARPGLRRP